MTSIKTKLFIYQSHRLDRNKAEDWSTESYLKSKQKPLCFIGSNIEVKLINEGAIEMIQLNPEFLKKNGKSEFVVLPYEEFLLLQDLLEDLEDLQDLRQAKTEEIHEPTLSLAEAKQRLNLQ